MSSTELQYFYHHLGILYKKKKYPVIMQLSGHMVKFPKLTNRCFYSFFSFLETSEVFETRIQSRLCTTFVLYLLSFLSQNSHTNILFFFNPCDMGILKKLEQSPYKITTLLMHCLLQHYLTCSYVSCIPCILKLN